MLTFWGEGRGDQRRAGGWDLGVLGCGMAQKGKSNRQQRAAASKYGKNVERWREASRSKHTTITDRKRETQRDTEARSIKVLSEGGKIEEQDEGKDWTKAVTIASLPVLSCDHQPSD